ncbi:hypothetical protein [Flavobacterium sp.]|uniref:hypothetical protein n=1 Tax=Flavobacterium sp. TaxID=239 RepID=UPI0025C1099D|nr:hypothetical protein [Flavobacterium sp.]
MRNHISEATEIVDLVCGVSGVISPFGRNDKTVYEVRRLGRARGFQVSSFRLQKSNYQII